MDIRDLGAMALILVIAAFIIGVGAQMLGTIPESICGYSWDSYLANSSGGDVFIGTGTYTGCCVTAATGQPNECTAWDDRDSYNISGSGGEGMQTFGDWLPLLALVIVLAIVIGLLIKQLGGTVGS